MHASSALESGRLCNRPTHPLHQSNRLPPKKGETGTHSRKKDVNALSSSSSAKIALESRKFVCSGGTGT